MEKLLYNQGQITLKLYLSWNLYHTSSPFTFCDYGESFYTFVYKNMEQELYKFSHIGIVLSVDF